MTIKITVLILLTLIFVIFFLYVLVICEITCPINRKSLGLLHWLHNKKWSPFSWLASQRRHGRSCPVFPVSRSFETFPVSLHRCVFCLHCNNMQPEFYHESLKSRTCPAQQKKFITIGSRVITCRDKKNTCWNYTVSQKNAPTLKWYSSKL